METLLYLFIMFLNQGKEGTVSEKDALAYKDQMSNYEVSYDGNVDASADRPVGRITFKAKEGATLAASANNETAN